MPPLRIALSRCSVCAADDVDAPHPRIVTVSDALPLRLFVQTVADSDYLPQISGGRATWVLELGAAVAVLAQQWRHARFLLNPETPLRSVFAEGRPAAAYLRYLAQTDPETEFRRLSRSKAEPPASPNDGPAERLGNSGVSGGPPSVS